MSLSTTDYKVQYTATGSTDTFSFPKRFLEDSDLVVYQDETKQTLNSDYTVTGAGGASGGSITFTAGNPTAGVIITIIREVSLTQAVDYVDDDDFPTDSHENAMDKAMMAAQQLKGQIDRTLTFPETEPLASNGELPSKTNRAGKAVTFDENGDLLVAQDVGQWRGDWATATAYVRRDTFKDTSDNSLYVVVSDHTSSSVAADLAAGKISQIIDVGDITTTKDDAEAAQLAAETAQGLAEASQSAAETAETNAETAEAKAEKWASESEDVVVESGEYSAKHYAAKASASASSAGTSETNASDSASAAGTSETNAAASEDLAEDWATKTSDTVDGSEYSSKNYAIGTGATAPPDGSSKEWATTAEDTEVAGGEYSAKHYAAKASESASTAASPWEDSSGNIQPKSDYAGDSILPRTDGGESLGSSSKQWYDLQTKRLNGDLMAALWASKYTGVNARTANYTLAGSDNGKLVTVDATSGDITVTLPGAPGMGYTVWIKKIDSSSNKVIIGGTVAGRTNAALLSEGDMVCITHNTSQYFLIGAHYTPRRIVYTSNGTLTTNDEVPLSCPAVLGDVVGSGASGGSSDDAGGHSGGGGGGGGRERKLILVDDLGATETITVGTGGASVSANTDTDGNNGNTTSIGSHISATGGTAGQDGAAASSGSTYAQGGIGSGGDLSLAGEPGIAYNDSTYIRGNGGSAPGMGGGGVLGQAGRSPGAGGGAGNSGNASGAGANGIAIIQCL